MLFFGAIINSIIFGNMSVILQSFNKKSTTFNEMLENANDIMKNLNLSPELMENIETYLAYIQNTYENQKELDSFLSMLAPSMKNKVTKYIFETSISKNTIFKNHPEVVKEILPKLNSKLFIPEDMIIAQNQIANSMFFISRGEWDIYVTDINKSEVLVNTICSGAYFGEIAILKDWPRTATVMSKSYSTIAEYSKVDFTQLLSRNPYIAQNMEKKIHKSYHDKWRKFIRKIIKNIDYFNEDIPDKIINETTYLFELITIEEDDYLFKKGNSWKEIYIIVNGELQILIGKYLQDTFLDTLYTGCITGWYGILNCEDYQFTGKAKSKLTVMKLPFSKLQELRIKHEKLDDKLTEYEDFLAENGMPYWDFKLHRNVKHRLSAIQKLKHGIKRIISIIRSNRTTAFSQLLDYVKDEVKKKSVIKEK